MDFCDWIKMLPYAKELIIGRAEQNERYEQNQKTDADSLNRNADLNQKTDATDQNGKDVNQNG